MAQSALSLTGRTRPPETSGKPAGPAAPTPSPAERRLKLVIESAPVSLLITDPESKLLAANLASLVLFGVDRLDDVIGKSLDRLIAAEDRERFMAFVGKVCSGESQTLQYDLVLPDGTRRPLETHAVPLRREASAPAAFLGATWDVSEKKRVAAALQQLQQKCDLLEAQRSADRESMEEAVQRARVAHDELAAAQRRMEADVEQQHAQLIDKWNAERDALLAKLAAVNDVEAVHTESTRQWSAERETLLSQLAALSDVERRYAESTNQWNAERDRLLAQLAALNEAEVRRGQATHQWSAEREALLSKLKDAEERHETLAAQLLIEQSTQRSALEQAEREYQDRLAERNIEREQLEKALHERSSERDFLGEALKSAKAAYEALADDRSRIQAALTEAEEQREHQNGQWSAEREGLLARVIALEHAQREHQAALAARNSENQQLERAMNDARACYEEMLAERQRERDELARQLEGTLAESRRDREELGRQLENRLAESRREREELARQLEDRLAESHLERETVARRLDDTLAKSRSDREQLERQFEDMLAKTRSDREGLERRLQEAERQHAAVIEKWQTELAGVLRPLKETSARVERLLTNGNGSSAVMDDDWPPSTNEQKMEGTTTESDGAANEEATWRF
jgi:PAS domain S-box-containing protein